MAYAHFGNDSKRLPSLGQHKVWQEFIIHEDGKVVVCSGASV